MSQAAARDAARGRPWSGWLRSLLLAAALVFPYALPFTTALRLRRSSLRWPDLVWLVAAALPALLFLVTGAVHNDLLTLPVGFFAYKGGQALGAPETGNRWRPSLGRAYVLASAALLAHALLQAAFGQDQRVAGPSWFLHPNIFGPVLLLLGLTAANHVDRRWRWPLVAATLLGLVLTGSRSALLAYFVTLGLAALLDRRWRRTALATLAAGAALVLVVSVAFPARTWAQRILSPVYATLGIERSAKNALIWTEELGNRTHWNAIGVATTRLTTPTGGLAVWSVKRTEPVAWARPQQAVEVSRGEPYTLSAALRPEAGAEPGFIGWADRPGVQVSFEVALCPEGPKVLRAAGLESASARVVDLGDGWRRLEFTFAVAGAGATTLGVGISPGLASESVRDTVDVRELQLEAGSAATAYAPAIHRTTGVGEALARGRIFSVAWRGVRAAPMFGHGRESFAEYYAAHDGTGTAPSHAHNAYLQVAFSSGVVGLVALLCVLAVLFVSSGPLQKALVLGLSVANLFDSAFTAGAVFYLLAFSVPAGGRAFVAPVRPGTRRQELSS